MSAMFKRDDEVCQNCSRGPNFAHCAEFGEKNYTGIGTCNGSIDQVIHNQRHSRKTTDCRSRCQKICSIDPSITKPGQALKEVKIHEYFMW